MPKVSVITPTYNRSRLLALAIRSVLAQSYPDFEMVIVDDGSTDETKEVVQSFGDERLVYVWQENQQRCAARNTGIARAQGEYIAFLDSDDVWFPTKLERQVDALKRHPEVGFVYTGHVRISEDNTFPNPFELLQTDSEEVGSIRDDLLVLNRIQVGTPLVRRDLLDRAGQFDPSLPHAEDWDMWIRISEFGDFCRIGAPLAAYRTHSGMRTANPLSTRRGDQIIIDRYLNGDDDKSRQLRLRAELLSYSRRAFEALMNDIPEARQWLAEAQRRAEALDEPGGAAEWITVVALTHITLSLDHRVGLSRLLSKGLDMLVEANAPIKADQHLRRFWAGCVRQDFRLQDYPGTLRAAWQLFSNCRPSKDHLRLSYTSARAALRYTMAPRKGRIVTETERRMLELLGSPADNRVVNASA